MLRSIQRPVRGALGAAALVAALGAPQPARSTAGFAEWEVYTPGGHLISHNDVWKAEHGTCLRSDAQPDASRAQIFASRLDRWRYYPGHVAGQDAAGFFLFDERTSEIVRLTSEAELLEALTQRDLAPETSWLGPADGWQEAWFPFMVWRPCKAVLGDDEALAGTAPEEREALRRAARATHTEDACRAALAPEKLALYRRTTWGRLCASWSERGYRSDEAPFLEAFCRDVRDAGS